MVYYYSKALLLFLLLLAVACSAFAVDQSQLQHGDDLKEPNQGGGGNCRYRRCCGSWYGRRCSKWCCSSSADADYEVIQPNQGGGSCRHWRCCGGWYEDRCRRWCCSYPENSADETEPASSIDGSTHNGGGHGGGGGGHGGGGGGKGGGGGGHGKEEMKN